MSARYVIAIIAAACCTFAWGGQPAGVVKIVKGSVELERGPQKREPAAGDSIEVGDRVVTGKDGRIGITLSDNTLL